jgi:hypothetical protein
MSNIENEIRNSDGTFKKNPERIAYHSKKLVDFCLKHYSDVSPDMLAYIIATSVYNEVVMHIALTAEPIKK